MEQAVMLYVDNFKPSKYLDKPQVLVTMKIIVGDTDEEAEKLLKVHCDLIIIYNAGDLHV
ncbi:hypothetical protein ACFQDF_25735 [Ectobacillus funiculus]